MKKTVFYSRGVGNHQLMLISFFILIIAVTFSAFTNYSSFIIYPIWALWLAYIFSNKGGFNKDERTFIIVSFAFLGIMLLYSIIGYSSIPKGGLLVNTNWLMAGVVAVYAMRLFTSRELLTVYDIMFLALALLMILYVVEGRTFLAVEDMDAAVDVTNAWYGALFMLLSGLSLIVLLNVRRLFPRLVALTVILLSLYLNVEILQRGTNVIMTAAELGLILLFLVKRKSIIVPLFVVIIVAVIIALSENNLMYLFEWLAQVVPSERLSIRFSAISQAMAFQSVEAGGGSLATRGELMATSWNTFTSSFGHIVFGAGEHFGNNNIIGHHSFFLDTLARYGIIGGSLMAVYFVKQYKMVMCFLDRNKEWSLYMQCAIVFVFYVLRNFYGDMAFALVNLVVLLFFPLTVQLIHYYQNKSK